MLCVFNIFVWLPNVQLIFSHRCGGANQETVLVSVFSFEFSTHNCVSRPQELPTKYK